MLIINEIDFNQKKVIGLETDEKLIELTLTKTKLKIVFNLEKIIIIKKKKNKENIVDVFVDEEDEIIEEIKDEIIEEVIEKVIKEVIEEVIKEEVKEEEETKEEIKQEEP